MKDIKNIKYKYNDKVLYRTAADLVMAYNQDNGDMYEFNEIGGQIFEMLSKNISIANILNELSTQYNATEEEIYEDVSQIISRMLELGIIIEE